jgi:hypothetical protein
MRRTKNHLFEKPVLKNEQHNTRQHNYQQRPKNMPTQFLQVFKKGHLLDLVL